MQGLESQNRSVEGDEVAFRILPPCAWWVFKREQLKAAQKAAANGSTDDAEGIDLGAGADHFQVTEVATPAGRPFVKQQLYLSLKTCKCCGISVLSFRKV